MLHYIFFVTTPDSIPTVSGFVICNNTNNTYGSFHSHTRNIFEVTMIFTGYLIKYLGVRERHITVFNVSIPKYEQKILMKRNK